MRLSSASIYNRRSPQKIFCAEKRPWKRFAIKCFNLNSGKWDINESTPHSKNNVGWISKKAELEISIVKTRWWKKLREGGTKIDPSTGKIPFQRKDLFRTEPRFRPTFVEWTQFPNLLEELDSTEALRFQEPCNTQIADHFQRSRVSRELYSKTLQVQKVRSIQITASWYKQRVLSKTNRQALAEVGYSSLRKTIFSYVEPISSSESNADIFVHE